MTARTLMRVVIRARSRAGSDSAKNFFKTLRVAAEVEKTLALYQQRLSAVRSQKVNPTTRKAKARTSTKCGVEPGGARADVRQKDCLSDVTGLDLHDQFVDELRHKFAMKRRIEPNVPTPFACESVGLNGEEFFRLDDQLGCVRACRIAVDHAHDFPREFDIFLRRIPFEISGASRSTDGSDALLFTDAFAAQAGVLFRRLDFLRIKAGAVAVFYTKVLSPNFSYTLAGVAIG